MVNKCIGKLNTRLCPTNIVKPEDRRKTIMGLLKKHGQIKGGVLGSAIEWTPEHRSTDFGDSWNQYKYALRIHTNQHWRFPLRSK